MRSRYKVLDTQQIYFITSTIVDWTRVFINENYFNILLDSIKYCQIHKGLIIYAYVILDNHFHMIVSNNNLSETISSLKRHSARKIVEQLKTENNKKILDLFRALKPGYKKESLHQVWQEGFHPQQILTSKILEQKVNYIHYNPVRRGHVNEPEKWLYSSANYYMSGKQTPIEIKDLIS